jgi:hypothetical protein
MRDLIDLLQNLSEATGVGNLAPNEFKNRAKRFDTFIAKIKAKQPFTTVDDQEVIIDPKEAERFLSIWDSKLVQFSDKSAQIANLAKGSKYNGESEIKLSNLKKTTEFGGAGVAAGADPTTGGKGSYQVKPAHIGICDKDIPATDLYKIISTNAVLNSTEYGKVIISLASYIVSGESVTLPEDVQKNDKLRAAIQDNAGEYLGVLALLYNRSRFPKAEQFQSWLGASIGEMTLRFPSTETEALADSYATISNKKTKHSINISSKGKGGGAAPSIKTGLKIPDHLKSNPKLKNAVQFVDMCIEQTTVNQAFDGIDIIYKAKPSSISKVWHQFLPFSNNPKLKQAIHARFKGEEVKLPVGFKPIIAGVASKEANDGGKIFYAMKKEVEIAVNEKDALPEFREMVLEILEMNFVQQYTDYQTKHIGELTFATQWPAKLDGKITLENKCSAKGPFDNGFSFKIGRTDDSVSKEPGEPEVDDGPNLPDVATAAADIVNPRRKQEPETPIGVGRELRRK